MWETLQWRNGNVVRQVRVSVEWRGTSQWECWEDGVILIGWAVWVKKNQLLSGVRVWLGIGPASWPVAINSRQPLGLALRPDPSAPQVLRHRCWSRSYLRCDDWLEERRRKGSDSWEGAGPLGDLERRLATFSPTSDFDVVYASVMWVQLVLTVDRQGTGHPGEWMRVLVKLRR